MVSFAELKEPRRLNEVVFEIQLFEHTVFQH